MFSKSGSWRSVHEVLKKDELYRAPHRLLTFLDNHDQPRFLSGVQDSYAKLRMALAFLYVARGIPVVYYGTEQHLAGDFRPTEGLQNAVNRQCMLGFEEMVKTHWLARLNVLRMGERQLLVSGGASMRCGIERKIRYTFLCARGKGHHSGWWPRSIIPRSGKRGNCYCRQDLAPLG